MKTLSTTNTVEMFQGNGSVPGDGPDAAITYTVNDQGVESPTAEARAAAVDPTGELRENRASDTGSTYHRGWSRDRRDDADGDACW